MLGEKLLSISFTASSINVYQASGKCPNLGLFPHCQVERNEWIKMGREVGRNAGGGKNTFEEWDLSKMCLLQVDIKSLCK